MGSIVKGVGKLLGFSEPEKPDYSKAIKAAEFKPYSLTTGFGTSTFDTKARTGAYTLDPRLAAMRDIFYGGAMAAVPDTSQQAFVDQLRKEGEGLFTSAAAMSPEQMAQDYVERQLDILAPSRAEEEARLADTLFKTGRTGAAVGMGQGYVNPEQFALLSSREMANKTLGLEALDRSRAIQQQDLQRALGYYGLASELEMQPYQQASTLFGLGTGIESLGAGTLQGGLSAGQMASGANQQVGQLLMNQENARVQAANSPGLFGSLIGGALTSFAPALGSWGARSLGLGGGSSWFSGGGGQAPGTGIRLF